VDLKNRKLIWNLCQGQAAYKKIGDLSSACSIGRGVRRGCSLLPLLYLLLNETMIRKAINDRDIGISVGSTVVDAIRYADDQAVVAKGQKRLQQLMNNLNKVTQNLV